MTDVLVFAIFILAMLALAFGDDVIGLVREVIKGRNKK